MKAPDFDYCRPGTLAEALSLLAGADGEAQPLAGGQSLMPMMNFRVAAPEILVDLAGIPELRGIARQGDMLRIGAMTTYRELQDDPALQAVPLIAMALPHIAHDAVRNRGTIGGSLALADAAAEMPALMMTLNAVIELAGPDGPREVPATEFFLGYYETACEPDELLVAVRVPVAQPGEVFGFHELVQRHGDYAMAGVAIRATGVAPIAGLAVGFFGVSDRALRVPAFEEALTGTDGSEAAIAAALPKLDAIEFEGDTKISAETRRHYAGVALKRALKEMLA
ncbi:FAD binding domain-containing protein [Roseisalinus antarcticus]|uniref:Carbon monoxide dehydrogenase medium chain n=1 Tax=Roseisalinus antarcticus TaxID=254357 RepID=A0A1Y5TY45_9RHOB|nr:xanthine dehydrogenase family protein subunit M [Roseisalinus antarcticus]SLN76767.1 Carbon monoxide dehydrogenase medium chain [Roseisalinus antarcticus]